MFRELVGNALARLVAVEQIVAKRLDRIVEGDRDVRHGFFSIVEQLQ